jgi:hypothetical protein
VDAKRFASGGMAYAGPPGTQFTLPPAVAPRRGGGIAQSLISGANTGMNLAKAGKALATRIQNPSMGSYMPAGEADSMIAGQQVAATSPEATGGAMEAASSAGGLDAALVASEAATAAAASAAPTAAEIAYATALLAMKGGGAVNGPGTETSDSIPARLSDGEFVLNAEAVKHFGIDKLEKMNRVGLEKRYGIGKGR